jgi:hypothetical protein
MTLREVLANRARRRMRLARESREIEVRPSHRRRLLESLEERKQNRFIESREETRARNHYILVEDENEDDLVEIEPDTSVAAEVAPEADKPVEKEDVVKTLQDLAAQLGYDITPKVESPVEEPIAPVDEPAPAPAVEEPAPEAPVEEPVAIEAPAPAPVEEPAAPVDEPAPAPEEKVEEVPEVEEKKECPEGECKEATAPVEAAPAEEAKEKPEVTTEADDDKEDEDKGDGEGEEDASAEDDKSDEDAPEGEENAGEDEPSDEDEKAEDDKEEEPVEIAPEDMPQDVEEVADLLSAIPNSKWNEIVGKILSGKQEE